MSATAAMLAASAETLVFSGRCFLSIFDANQPQFLYEFPTIGIWLKLIKSAFAEIPSRPVPAVASGICRQPTVHHALGMRR
jgi:hypothetical protein